MSKPSATEIKDNAITILGVSALIKDENGKILLLDHAKLGWTVPVGKVDVGETREDAITREIREELGIELSNLKLIGTTRFETRYAVPEDWTGPSYNDNYMYEASWSGELENIEPHKHKELKFFTEDEIIEILATSQTKKGANEILLNHINQNKG